ncbi:MAG: TolB-like translocation protein [Nitrososphaerales archaeon]
MRKATDNPEVIHSFGSFSPDGRKISYSSNLRNQTSSTYTSRTLKQTLGNSFYQSDETNTDIQWSPIGGKLLFKTIHSPFDHELFSLDLSSRHAEPILNHEGDAVFDYATFSKDGSTIYCISDVGREFTALARIKDHKIDCIHSEILRLSFWSKVLMENLLHSPSLKTGSICT